MCIWQQGDLIHQQGKMMIKDEHIFHVTKSEYRQLITGGPLSRVLSQWGYFCQEIHKLINCNYHFSKMAHIIV
jgi:hypothetical protein